MAYVDFLQKLHSSTPRDYVQRVVDHDKAECATIARQWGKDYWDGDRCHGYGGYSYDGRWLPVAEAIARHYDLKPGMRILDVGCGKGFLLHEFTRAVPGIEIFGVDVSEYGLENAKEEVKPHVQLATATDLPFPDQHFDFVISLGALHNLYNYDLDKALKEIERVGKGSKYIMIESYRNEREKANLLYWQLTCYAFHTPDEWQWLMDQAGYSGDFGCIYFE